MSTIVNIAKAKGSNTNASNGQASIIFNGNPSTKLQVIKTADVSSVVVGDNFTYTIVVTNIGDQTATGVVMTDSAPNHINFIVSGVTTTQGTVDPSSTPLNLIVNVGNILPGQSVTITIPADVVL